MCDICIVPRILHITFPESWRIHLVSHLNRVNVRNPGWEVRTYNDAEQSTWVQDNCTAQERSAYSRINPEYGAARADFFRYLLLREAGGVYLDATINPTAPLNNVLPPADCLLTYEGNRGKIQGCYQQWWLASVAHHPVMHAAVNEVVRRIESGLNGYGESAVLNITGPFAFTAAVLPLSRLVHTVCSTTLGFRFRGVPRASLPGVPYSKLTSQVVLNG